MTVPKFQTPLAYFEKWLSPDFTCQEVEEAQKVSLKGCVSATTPELQEFKTSMDCAVEHGTIVNYQFLKWHNDYLKSI